MLVPRPQWWWLKWRNLLVRFLSSLFILLSMCKKQIAPRHGLFLVKCSWHITLVSGVQHNYSILCILWGNLSPQLPNHLFPVMTAFEVYSLSKFQIYKLVLITVVNMVYVTSAGLTYLGLFFKWWFTWSGVQYIPFPGELKPTGSRGLAWLIHPTSGREGGRHD